MITTHLLLKTDALDKIQEMIFRGDYKQGELFSENDVAKKLGISRTPIREALADLERQGLVIKIPQVGVRVVEFSDNDLREIYEAREFLEGRSAEILAASAGRDELQTLERLLSEMKNSAEDGETAGFLKSDIEFHWQIAAGAKRPLYRDWLVQMGNRVRIEGWISSPTKESMRVVIEEHTVILEAIRRHDPKAARASAIQHIVKTKERLNSNSGRVIFHD